MKNYRQTRRLDYEQVEFVRHTGASDAAAARYLKEANGDLAAAINAYMVHYGSDIPIEELSL